MLKTDIDGLQRQMVKLQNSRSLSGRDAQMMQAAALLDIAQSLREISEALKK